MAASRDLGAHALRLYLYLSANADGYALALSPAAIRQDVGIARSTYHDQFQILIDKGYLVPRNGNGYDFFETPQPRPGNNKQKEDYSACAGYDFENDTLNGQPLTADKQHNPSVNTEINNTQKNTDNEINMPSYQTKTVRIPSPSASKKDKSLPVSMPPVGDFVF